MIDSWWIALAIVLAVAVLVGLLTKNASKTVFSIFVTAAVVIMFKEEDLVFLEGGFTGHD